MGRFLLVGFSVLVVLGCHRQSTPSAPPVPVTAMRIEPQTIPANFEYVGVGESSHIVQLRARVEGYLEAITYKEGGMVKAGDLMFILDQRPFQAVVESNQGMLDRQKAVLWDAQQSKARMVPLYQQNAVSQRDLDNALSRELAAEADVATAQADLYKAELNLGFASISSPVTGMASQAKYREGALIDPAENLLTTIYVVDPIWVNFSVSDNDLLKMRQEIEKKRIVFPKNHQFTVEAVLGDGTVVPSTGFIDFTNPAIQQSTGTMLIRAVLPNSPTLIYPGQFVRAIVKGAIRPNAILVPQTSVVQGKNGTFVYVVENGKAVMRMVTAGDWYKDYWIIYEGLKTGDVVITQGVNKVQNNSPVTINSLIPSLVPTS